MSAWRAWGGSASRSSATTLDERPASTTVVVRNWRARRSREGRFDTCRMTHRFLDGYGLHQLTTTVVLLQCLSAEAERRVAVMGGAYLIRLSSIYLLSQIQGKSSPRISVCAVERARLCAQRMAAVVSLKHQLLVSFATPAPVSSVQGKLHRCAGVPAALVILIGLCASTGACDDGHTDEGDFRVVAQVRGNRVRPL